MNCNCVDCYRKKIVKNQVLPYNKDLLEAPLLVVKNKQRLIPIINNNKLIIPNENVIYIFPRTLIYLNLTELDISGNSIKYMPDIQSLKILKCNNCNIKTLPILPNLEILECSNNFISEIPKLMKLTHINCSYNMIARIPDLPEIKHLICSNNPITNISHTTLLSLEAYNCPILTIHKIPTLLKRSSLVIDNRFLWIRKNIQKIERRYVILDWNTIDVIQENMHHKLNISKLSKKWQKIVKFIL